MKPPYFIETLARNGEVLSRQRVAGLPILLGRGYDNDCILDDAHIGANHAVIEPDAEGRLLLRDLGSKNGVVWRGRRHASIALEADTVVRLGQTHLRVRGADCPVPAELADTSS
ncbi:MAG: FHA domain-containing protein, partial [Burkholderiaceae bacterium]|nr:FHA domain-containing protein [Burkholderiaceae bacterium]